MDREDPIQIQDAPYLRRVLRTSGLTKPFSQSGKKKVHRKGREVESVSEEWGRLQIWQLCGLEQVIPSL